MSIFGNEGDSGFGSLGMGAPDTGRGDAFDQQARRRGYGISPSLGTEIDFDQPRGVPIPPGTVYGGIEFGTPRDPRIPPGAVIDGIEFGTPRVHRLPARQGVFGGGVAGLGAAPDPRRIALLRKQYLLVSQRLAKIAHELRKLGVTP
jgi:hypothetical protein